MESERFKHLEDRIEQLEKKVDGSVEILKKIEIGLFGDDSINYLGVIKTQVTLQSQIDTLKGQIEDIKRKNTEQDTQIEAKKSIKGVALKIGEKLLTLIINALMLYLVFKGLVGPDAMIK